MASSSSITPSSVKKYDVFLSWSDVSPPYSFTRRLRGVLVENNISTFSDGIRFQRGDVISPALLNAIEESRISVIIFSKGYASSRRSLEELVKILECRERLNQIVIPVYYDIEPSHVRDQTGPFADAFKNHEAHKSVQKWRVALTEASSLPGHNFSEFKSNTTLTRVIADDILKKLGCWSIGGTLKRYRVCKDEEELYGDIVNFIKQNSGHKDEEEDSGDEDKEAINDENENIREEVLHIVNIIKQYSGHKDEVELHSDIIDILNRYIVHKDENGLHYDIGNIRKRYSGYEEAIHDVFLSCSDEHSPYSFTSHLYKDLRENKISTFIDDSRLQRRDEISSSRLNAIEKSRISLIIFSKAYADSRWCLDELVQILGCREKYKQIVIPVFYDIDPSDVRHQTGPLAEAFKKHEASFDVTSSVPKWRAALTKASSLPGPLLLTSRDDFFAQFEKFHLVCAHKRQINEIWRRKHNFNQQPHNIIVRHTYASISSRH